MSGRQDKLTRREIRRAAESGLRAMVEAQDAAIRGCVERVNALIMANQIMAQKIASLEKRIVALKAPMSDTPAADAHLGAVEATA